MDISELNQLKQLMQFKQVACETAVSAGHLIRDKWSQPRQISEKGFRDFVTDADIAAQTLITNAIQKAFPHHGFITEEKDGRLPKKGDILWIIDPVDGTTNYSRQQPVYCVSIAAAKPHFDTDGTLSSFEPIVGAIYDPMQDELFHAAKGQKAWLNDIAMTVSKTETITYTIVGVDWSYNRELRYSARDLLPHFGKEVNGVRCLGSAALALAWVANGRYDGYLNCNLKAWDWPLLFSSSKKLAARLRTSLAILASGVIHNLRRLRVTAVSTKNF
jgi:myo-inositol-1(or 4)-monophosphatase